MMKFTPWRPFKAFRDWALTTRYLDHTGRLAVRLFRHEMVQPKSGRLYWRPGRLHRASANDGSEFPANDFGPLRASADSDASKLKVEMGTNMPYSKFLREGTGKMHRRRMSDDAMQLAIPLTRPELKGWVKWKRK